MLKRTCGVESWRRRETCALGPLMVVGRILELEKKRRAEKQGLNYVVGKKRRTKGAASVAVAGERKGKRDTKINCHLGLCLRIFMWAFLMSRFLSRPLIMSFLMGSELLTFFVNGFLIISSWISCQLFMRKPLWKSISSYGVYP